MKAASVSGEDYFLLHRWHFLCPYLVWGEEAPCALGSSHQALVPFLRLHPEYLITSQRPHHLTHRLGGEDFNTGISDSDPSSECMSARLCVCAQE